MAFKYSGNQDQDERQQSFQPDDNGADVDGKLLPSSFLDQESFCETKPRSSTERSVTFTEDAVTENSSPPSLSSTKLSVIKDKLIPIFLEMENNISPIVSVIAEHEVACEDGTSTETRQAKNFSMFETLWLSPEETIEGARGEARLVHIGRPGRTPATKLVGPVVTGVQTDRPMGTSQVKSSDVEATLDTGDSNEVESDPANSKESSFYEYRG